MRNLSIRNQVKRLQQHAQTNKKTWQRAYSLVEMSVVMTIIGVVAAGGIALGTANQESEKAELTARHMDAIEKAIVQHTYSAGYLPCPANPTLRQGDANYGLSADCNGAKPAAIENGGLAGNDEVWIGAVPTRSLNIPDKYMYDGWRNRFSFAVIRELAKDEDSFSDFTATGTNGVIRILDANGVQIPATDTNNVISYALISHGKDMKGAYTRSGTMPIICGAATLDDDNCDYDTDVTFVDSWINDSQVPANYYDDMVRWKARSFVEPLSDETVGGSTVVSGPVVNTGYQFSCAVLPDGRGFCWGAAGLGRLGNNTWGGNFNSPQEIDGAHTDWTQIDAGTLHACGIRGGVAYCWGEGSDGQIGNGGTSDVNVPTLVSGGFTDWQFIAAGTYSSCGIRATGQAYCWGKGTEGNIGDGNNSNRTTPTLVSGGYTDWEEIGVFNSNSGSTAPGSVCGRRANGEIYCWGSRRRGGLGDGSGTSGSVNIPTLIAGGFSDWSYLYPYSENACAIRGGTAYCWGSNHVGSCIGAMGIGNNTQDHDTPQPVDGGFTDWARIGPNVGLRDNGTLWMWGGNASGRLGDGTTDACTPAGEYLSPTQVGTDTDWQDYGDSDDDNMCAVKNDGVLYCWGNNSNGQVGVGSASALILTPTAVTFP